MVNRTMQQKTLKLRKAKRLFPRRYSADAINVGTISNPIVMQEYKARAKGIGVDTAFIDAMFGINIRENKRFSEHVHTPRKDVQKLREKLMEDVPFEHHIVVEQTRHTTLILFFEYNDGKAYFHLVDKFLQRVKKSKRYPTLTYAKQILQMGKSCIHWQETFDIPPP